MVDKLVDLGGKRNKLRYGLPNLLCIQKIWPEKMIYSLPPYKSATWTVVIEFQ